MEGKNMSFINKYLRNFTPYKVASHKIWNVSAEERKFVIKLDWNEATVQPSPMVIKRLKRLVNDDGKFYNYYPAVCNSELITLLSKYLDIPEGNIQYFAGSDSLHEYIAKLYISVGDPILICGPSYDNFRLTAEVCGASIYYYNMASDFNFNRKKFEDRIKEVIPSLVYMCNPNNPTGTLNDIEYIEELLIRYPDILFLVDEAYAEFAGVSAKNLVLKYENIIISRTMSKAFAIANFRIGYLIASERNIKYISSIRNPKNITTFAQEAAIGALSDIEYMKNYVNEVNLAKNQLKNFLDDYKNKKIAYVDSFGNFLLLVCPSKENKTSMINFLENKNIFIRDLSQTDYLKERGVRITIGTREQMKRVEKALKEFWV